jgi:hypothetical protein
MYLDSAVQGQVLVCLFHLELVIIQYTFTIQPKMEVQIMLWQKLLLGNIWNVSWIQKYWNLDTQIS